MRATRAGHIFVAVLTASAALTACATGARSGNDDVGRRSGSGTVLSGEALLDGQGSVLDAMRGKVPNLKIQRFHGQCPHVALRNDATLQTVVSPQIYVDGTRALDTCILESLRSRDVRRIEVYPSGVSGRPEYPSHPYGLILVFLRS